MNFPTKLRPTQANAQQAPMKPVLTASAVPDIFYQSKLDFPLKLSILFITIFLFKIILSKNKLAK